MAILLAARPTLGQGTVLFSTRVPGQVDAPVTANGIRVGSAFLGQLYAGPPGSGLQAVGTPVPFRNDPALGYITSGGVIAIPGVPAGAASQVKLVAWDTTLGASYEEAASKGVGGFCETEPIAIPITGGAGVPANLVGLKGCDVFELPAPMALPTTFLQPPGSANTLQPGFRWRIHQVEPGGGQTLPNDNIRTENQLSGALGPNTANPLAIGAAEAPGSPQTPTSGPIEFTLRNVINLSQTQGQNNGRFFNDRAMPGVPGRGGSTDNLAAEILTWLELPQGTYRLVVNSDDGFRLHLGGATPEDRFAPLIGEFSGGRGAADTTNTFRVTQAGLYAARITWEEGLGDANIEVFTLREDQSAVLLNDASNDGLRAYRSVSLNTPAYASRVVPVPGNPTTDFDSPILVELLDGTSNTGIVDPSSVRLFLDGSPLTPTVTKSGNRTSVRYQPTSPIPPGPHSARITFSAGEGRSHDWTFSVPPYAVLTPDMRVTPDVSRPGFLWTVFQNAANTQNASTRAEAAIAGQLEGPSGLLTNQANPSARGAAVGDGVRVGPSPSAPYQFQIPGTLNLNQNATAEAAGNFTPDAQMPGIPGITGSTDGIAAETLTWVTLPAGAVTLGVNSDDGFVTHALWGANPTNRLLLGSFDSPDGRAAADTLFKFWVQEAGTYPLRTLWYEGTGGASLEWFSVLTNQARVLLNAPAAGAFRAYRPPAVPPQNTAPLMAAIPPQATRSVFSVNVPFSVSDPDTPPEALGFNWSASDADRVRNVRFGLLETGEFVATLILAPGQPGLITLTLSVSDGSASSSRSFPLLVRTGSGNPTIVLQPQEIAALPGENRFLSVLADGEDPLRFVWRRNGAVIRNANSSTLPLNNIQPEDGGTYSVVVYNNQGRTESTFVDVHVTVPVEGDLVDDWPPPRTINATSGYLEGSNINADTQPEEPDHANAHGGHSLWFAWTPTVSGIATLRTLGSSFDTVLAVYRRTTDPKNPWRRIADNEDGEELGAHYFNSQVRFNVRANERQEVAVDGFFGATGRVLVHFEIEPTADTVPVILEHPRSFAVSQGTSSVTLSVTAEDPGRPITQYDWYRNGRFIASRTSPTLVIGPVTSTNIGQYHVEVSNGVRTTRSARGSLELAVAHPPPVGILPQDFMALTHLAFILKHASDPMVTFLRSRLSPLTLTELSRWQVTTNLPEPLSSLLLVDMDHVVRGESIHEVNRFAGIPLRPETRWYLEQASTPDDVARLNRLLLEDALPDTLLARRDEAVASEDKFQRAVRSRVLRSPSPLRPAGRYTLAGPLGSAVPVFPGTPYRHLLTVTTNDNSQLFETECGAVLENTRWLELTTTRPGTLVADTLGSDVPSTAMLYSFASPQSDELSLLACGMSGALDASWNLVVATNVPPGSYYAKVDSLGGAGRIQFNWILLTNDAAGKTLPHLGIQTFLTNIPGIASTPAANRSPLQAPPLIRLTLDPSGLPPNPATTIEAMDSMAPQAPTTLLPFDPAPPASWIRLLSVPTQEAPAARFFRIRPRRRPPRTPPHQNASRRVKVNVRSRGYRGYRLSGLSR